MSGAFSTISRPARRNQNGHLSVARLAWLLAPATALAFRTDSRLQSFPMHLSQISNEKSSRARSSLKLLLWWGSYVVLFGGIVFMLTTGEKQPVGATSTKYQIAPNRLPLVPSQSADNLPLTPPKCAGAILGLSLRLSRKLNSNLAANSLARITRLIVLDVQRHLPQSLPLLPPRPLDRRSTYLGCCVLVI